MSLTWVPPYWHPDLEGFHSTLHLLPLWDSAWLGQSIYQVPVSNCGWAPLLLMQPVKLWNKRWSQLDWASVCVLKCSYSCKTPSVFLIPVICYLLVCLEDSLWRLAGICRNSSPQLFKSFILHKSLAKRCGGRAWCSYNFPCWERLNAKLAVLGLMNTPKGPR